MKKVSIKSNEIQKMKNTRQHNTLGRAKEIKIKLTHHSGTFVQESLSTGNRG